MILPVYIILCEESYLTQTIVKKVIFVYTFIDHLKGIINIITRYIFLMHMTLLYDFHKLSH